MELIKDCELLPSYSFRLINIKTATCVKMQAWVLLSIELFSHWPHAEKHVAKFSLDVESEQNHKISGLNPAPF